MAVNSSKAILVTGATGKQGGSVVDALLERDADFTILAVTRNPESSSAQKLAAKSSKIKLVQGDLKDVPSLFRVAKRAVTQPIWGVYSVQVSEGRGVTHDGEIAQGENLIDESLREGVKFFVYSSVDRGGDERSWANATSVPHFQSKYQIEHHLKDAAGDKMGWTVLRPVAFMDNLSPGFPAKVFLTAMESSLQGKRMQWVACRDIGYFAAEAFTSPEQWNGKAIGLAGDELTVDEVNGAFAKKGAPIGLTFFFLGTFLKWAVGELGTMIEWFGAEGYGADIAKARSINPGLMNMEEWIVSAGFAQK